MKNIFRSWRRYLDISCVFIPICLSLKCNWMWLISAQTNIESSKTKLMWHFLVKLPHAQGSFFSVIAKNDEDGFISHACWLCILETGYLIYDTGKSYKMNSRLPAWCPQMKTREYCYTCPTSVCVWFGCLTCTQLDHT